MGEHHLHLLDSFYSYFLETLRSKDQNFECLVLEANKSGENIPQSSKRFKSIGISKGYKVFYVDDAGEIPSRFKLSSEELKKLLENKPQKYRALMMDMFNWALEDSQHRNRFIASEILELIKSKTCKKIVGIFGSAHFSKSDHPKDPTPIQTQLINNNDFFSEVFTIFLKETKTTLAGLKSLGNPATIDRNLGKSEKIWTECLIESDFRKAAYVWINDFKKEDLGVISEIFIPQGLTFGGTYKPLD